jgi:serine/threonine-protein phosphatase 2B catalytic subunit
MLVAVLNTCTKEELEESDDEAALISPTSVTSEDSVERRKVIKNKIMAVGRMARVFALLRLVHEIYVILGYRIDIK